MTAAQLVNITGPPDSVWSLYANEMGASSPYVELTAGRFSTIAGSGDRGVTPADLAAYERGGLADTSGPTDTGKDRPLGQDGRTAYYEQDENCGQRSRRHEKRLTDMA